jgi:hypothetical protein
MNYDPRRKKEKMKRNPQQPEEAASLQRRYSSLDMLIYDQKMNKR